MADSEWISTEPVKEFSAEWKFLDGDLRDRRRLVAFEGGVVYSGSYDGQPCLVTDEGTLEDLSPELGPIHPLVAIFASEEHREAYINSTWLSEGNRRAPDERPDSSRS